MIERLARRFPFTAMISALVVWILHFAFVYGVIGLHCERPEVLGRAGMWVWVIGGSVLAIGAIVVIGAAAALTWKRNLGDASTVSQRRLFMARVAALSALVGVLAVLMVLLPMLFVPPCLGWSPS